MARARNIKPGFFKNADLVELPMDARLLFIGLWTLADRAGRLEDRPKQIKMELFPADDVDVDACLDGLQNWGFVSRYEIDGKRLLQVINFDKHQNPHRDEKVSELPSQDGLFDVAQKKHGANTIQKSCKDGCSTVAIGLIPESLSPDSLTNEPNGSCRQPKASDAPACPYQSIVELYHEKLPELPGVRVMDEKRKRRIKAFWVWVLTSKRTDNQRRAHDADQALTWIGQYFERATLNDFVMGRAGRAGDHRNWRADIEYLCSEAGRKQVIEKTVDA